MAIQLGIYRHSKKGTLYRVIAIAAHSETLEPMVVYEAQYENPVSKIWVRPASMFEELVEVGGKKVPRFVFVGEEE
jgi:hypothetical protein